MGFNLYKWVKKNDEVSRLFPVFFGGASFFLVLINRTLSGIAPVADASRLAKKRLEKNKKIYLLPLLLISLFLDGLFILFKCSKYVI